MELQEETVPVKQFGSNASVAFCIPGRDGDSGGKVVGKRRIIWKIPI